MLKQHINPKRMEDDDMEILQIADRGSSMFRTTKKEICCHQVFLDEDIGPPSKYRDLINMLYMAGDDDEINLFINSSGGYLSSALAIIEAIKGSSATVRAIVNGECHSAASMITLNCHEIAVTNAAHMMVHTASYGAGGNSHMVQKHVEFSTAHVRRIIDQTYTGFLTAEELDKVHTGVEYWFDAREISKRLDNRQKYLMEKKAAKKPSKRSTKAAKDAEASTPQSE